MARWKKHKAFRDQKLKVFKYGDSLVIGLRWYGLKYCFRFRVDPVPNINSYKGWNVKAPRIQQEKKANESYIQDGGFIRGHRTKDNLPDSREFLKDRGPHKKGKGWKRSKKKRQWM